MGIKHNPSLWKKQVKNKMTGFKWIAHDQTQETAQQRIYRVVTAYISTKHRREQWQRDVETLYFVSSAICMPQVIKTGMKKSILPSVFWISSLSGVNSPLVSKSTSAAFFSFSTAIWWLDTCPWRTCKIPQLSITRFSIAKRYTCKAWIMPHSLNLVLGIN